MADRRSMANRGVQVSAVAAVAVVVVVGVVSACSGRRSPRTPSHAGAPAVVATASIGPVTLPDRPEPLVETIGRQVRTARSVHAEVVVAATDGGSELEHTVADLRTDIPSPSARLTIVDRSAAGAPAATTYAVVTGGVVYVRVDGQEQEPGKPWARLARQDAADPKLGSYAKLFTEIYDQTDRALRDLSADTGLALVRNGRLTGRPVAEELDGVRVRRYEGSTDSARMAKADPAFRQAAAAGLTKVPWTLWVDDRGLPRKFVIAVAVGGARRAQSTATYTSWGVPVTVQAPAANQVSGM